VWARNPYFGDWNVDEAGNPLPYLDGRVHRIAESDALLNLFLAGELDLFAPRTLDDIGVINVAIQNGDIDAELIEGYGGAASSQFIVFNWNLASDPFLESRVPQRELPPGDVAPRRPRGNHRAVYGGAAEPMHSGVYLPNAYWLDDSVPTYDYDPERALELLARAGFSQTRRPGLPGRRPGATHRLHARDERRQRQREQITQIFADDAQAIGVDVTPTALDFSLLVDQLLSTGDDRPFEAILIGLRRRPHLAVRRLVYNCDGFLHMYNTSGACLTPSETAIEQLNKLGRQTLDTDPPRARSGSRSRRSRPSRRRSSTPSARYSTPPGPPTSAASCRASTWAPSPAPGPGSSC
jgi:peptide/nickel transport system substrate-binding protein